MKQIDLDDLPPRIAQTLGGLAQGEELLLVQGGAVVGRLVVADPAPPPPEGDLLADLAPEERVKEVLEQFSAMINDEF
jgi:antitoxin (DNA-binding transcriptional repressor) of toxin-antitoxin stability system